jgi:hypothetical protein
MFFPTGRKSREGIYFFNRLTAPNRAASLATPDSQPITSPSIKAKRLNQNRFYPDLRLTAQRSSVECRHTDAGWSSLVARRAHNPKVVGSNPAPATKHQKRLLERVAFFVRAENTHCRSELARENLKATTGYLVLRVFVHDHRRNAARSKLAQVSVFPPGMRNRSDSRS